MNNFLKEFKKLNPNIAESRAKEIYNEQKKREKNSTSIEIIKVPSIQKPIDPVPIIIPEKTEEEIQQEREEEEEKARKEAEEELKNLKRKNIEIILDLWGNNLARSLQENNITNAYPQFPLHPMTRNIVSPVDIFTIIRDVDNFNKETDENLLIPPFLLVILASDKPQLLKIYDEFIRNPLRAPIQLRNFFLQKGIKYNNSWIPMILPPLRHEYIQTMRNELQYNFPKTINLEEINIEHCKKAPLEDVLSLHELLEKISKDPTILHKISDHELEFYNLNTPQIMELRTLFAEKNKTKQNKLLKNFIKNLNPESSNENSNDKTKQTGGKINNEDTSIMATFI